MRSIHYQLSSVVRLEKAGTSLQMSVTISFSFVLSSPSRIRMKRSWRSLKRCCKNYIYFYPYDNAYSKEKSYISWGKPISINHQYTKLEIHSLSLHAFHMLLFDCRFVCTHRGSIFLALFSDTYSGTFSEKRLVLKSISGLKMNRPWGLPIFLTLFSEIYSGRFSEQDVCPKINFWPDDE